MCSYKYLGWMLALLLILSSWAAMAADIYGEVKEVVVSDELQVVETAMPVTVKTGTTAVLAESAKSAILIDAGSGTVLYEKNCHERLPPASITKIMTMLLTLEAVERGQISLQDKVTISQRAASMGGSQMYMEQGAADS